MYTKRLFYYAGKALHRLWRIVTLRPGAYGRVGKHNSYRGCRINEAAVVKASRVGKILTGIKTISVDKLSI